MRNRSIIALTAVIGLVCTAATQRPTLRLNKDRYDKVIQLTGQTNMYYRLESSRDFTNWTPTQSYFLHTNNPTTQYYWNDGVDREYIRASVYPTNWFTMNNSIADTCPEHDNLCIVFRTNASRVIITSTHPTDYVVSNNVCVENWQGCPNVVPITDIYQGPYVKVNIYDIGAIYVLVTREEWFWRPLGMTMKKDGVTTHTNITFLELGGNIPGTGEYPIYLALYADGYLRSIPFPPANFNKVCFGSSVLVGPAEVENRPHADIASIDFRTATRTLNITYRDGGTATLDANTISRASATVRISINYPTVKSTCMLRSMYVADGNSDCDQVVWTDSGNVVRTNAIMPFSGTSGKSWLFKKHTRPIQRESAPNTKITFE